MTSGCCCNWTVPAGVQRVYWELWGAGGNGHGSCSCRRCYNWHGAGGGYYNAKTLGVSSGNSYTVCAGMFIVVVLESVLDVRDVVLT